MHLMPVDSSRRLPHTPDKLAATKVSDKDFSESRALGRGAFGAVFLTFKKDTGYAHATKKMVKVPAANMQLLCSSRVYEALPALLY